MLMSQEIYVERRNVDSIVTLLGDIGGMNELLVTIIGVLIGKIATTAYHNDRIEEFYRENKNFKVG